MAVEIMGGEEGGAALSPEFKKSMLKEAQEILNDPRHILNPESEMLPTGSSESQIVH